MVLRNGLPRNTRRISVEGGRRGWRRASSAIPQAPIAEKGERWRGGGFKANTKAVDKKFRPVKTVVSPVERDTVLDSDRRANSSDRPGEIE